MFSISDHSHRRYNALTGEWVQVSPHRAKRPWQGQQEKVDEEQRPQHDPSCYLCARNTRVNGEVNPDYKDVYAFDNDFAALPSDIPSGEQTNGFFQFKSERGICRVICFSPRHDLTIPEIDVDGIEKVVDLWVEECLTISKHDFINHIQIFENKGSVMGCSNPHPHGQIWAQETIPTEPEKKDERQRDYFNANGSILLTDYLNAEKQAGERILYENEDFMVLVPYWAIWPYEAMIAPKRAMQHITEMSQNERHHLADAYQWLTIRYDNLFLTSFSYSAGIHQAPFDGNSHPHWHWHMVFYPPLLRSATVKKFMVGYEMLGNAQRDITAEQAAETLNSQSGVHYKKLK